MVPQRAADLVGRVRPVRSAAPAQEAARRPAARETRSPVVPFATTAGRTVHPARLAGTIVQPAELRAPAATAAHLEMTAHAVATSRVRRVTTVVPSVPTAIAARVATTDPPEAPRAPAATTAHPGQTVPAKAATSHARPAKAATSRARPVRVAMSRARRVTSDPPVALRAPGATAVHLGRTVPAKAATSHACPVRVAMSRVRPAKAATRRVRRVTTVVPSVPTAIAARVATTDPPEAPRAPGATTAHPGRTVPAKAATSRVRRVTTVVPSVPTAIAARVATTDPPEAVRADRVAIRRVRRVREATSPDLRATTGPAIGRVLTDLAGTTVPPVAPRAPAATGHVLRVRVAMSLVRSVTTAPSVTVARVATIVPPADPRVPAGTAARPGPSVPARAATSRARRARTAPRVMTIALRHHGPVATPARSATTVLTATAPRGRGAPSARLARRGLTDRLGLSDPRGRPTAAPRPVRLGRDHPAQMLPTAARVARGQIAAPLETTGRGRPTARPGLPLLLFRRASSSRTSTVMHVVASGR